MTHFPISSGQGVDPSVGLSPPFGNPENPTGAKAAMPEIAPAPPVFETDKKSEWASEPSLANQRFAHPDTVKLHDIKAEVFDLSNVEQLKKYNDLLHRTNPEKGDVVIVRDEPSFSEKTDNWKTLVQYRTYLFKRILPTKTS